MTIFRISLSAGKIHTRCPRVFMYGHYLKQSMDQPCKVANPARGQLKREN